MTDRSRTVRSRLGRFLRRVLLLTGVAVLGVALVVGFVPGLEEYLPVEAAIETLGSDYVAVAVVGVAAVAFTALVVVVRRLGGVDEATPPPVETVPSASYPGESFDRSTENRRFGLVNRSSGVDRERLRQGAIRAVSHAENCSRSVAERRVVEGSWTDDPVAARFLASDGESVAGAEPSPSSSPPTDAGRSGPPSHARRTAEAIVRVHAGEEDREDSSQVDSATSPRAEPVVESAGSVEAPATDRAVGNGGREPASARRRQQSGHARAQRTDGSRRADERTDERDVRRERLAYGAERTDGGQKRISDSQEHPGRGEERTDGSEERTDGSEERTDGSEEGTRDGEEP